MIVTSTEDDGTLNPLSHTEQIGARTVGGSGKASSQIGRADWKETTVRLRSGNHRVTLFRNAPGIVEQVPRMT